MQVSRLYLAFGLITILVLGGCHSHPPSHTHRNPMPLRDRQGRAGSLVMSSVFMRSSPTTVPHHDAWYAGRNDIGPSVSAGYTTMRHEHSITHTRDRQYISNGRVRDRYNQTTHRRTERHTVR